MPLMTKRRCLSSTLMCIAVYWILVCVKIQIVRGSLRERGKQNAFSVRPYPSNFSCKGRHPGYYADVELNCEVYHLCNRHGGGLAFECPQGTKFQQRTMVCDHGHAVDCAKSPRFYDNNLRIGHRDKKLIDDPYVFMQVMVKKENAFTHHKAKPRKKKIHEFSNAIAVNKGSNRAISNMEKKKGAFLQVVFKDSSSSPRSSFHGRQTEKTDGFNLKKTHHRQQRPRVFSKQETSFGKRLKSEDGHFRRAKTFRNLQRDRFRYPPATKQRSIANRSNYFLGQYLLPPSIDAYAENSKSYPEFTKLKKVVKTLPKRKGAHEKVRFFERKRHEIEDKLFFNNIRPATDRDARKIQQSSTLGNKKPTVKPRGHGPGPRFSSDRTNSSLESRFVPPKSLEFGFIPITSVSTTAASTSQTFSIAEDQLDEEAFFFTTTEARKSSDDNVEDGTPSPIEPALPSINPDPMKSTLFDVRNLFYIPAEETLFTNPPKSKIRTLP